MTDIGVKVSYNGTLNRFKLNTEGLTHESIVSQLSEKCSLSDEYCVTYLDGEHNLTDLKTDDDVIALLEVVKTRPVPVAIIFVHDGAEPPSREEFFGEGGRHAVMSKLFPPPPFKVALMKIMSERENFPDTMKDAAKGMIEAAKSSGLERKQVFMVKKATLPVVFKGVAKAVEEDKDSEGALQSDAVEAICTEVGEAIKETPATEELETAVVHVIRTALSTDEVMKKVREIPLSHVIASMEKMKEHAHAHDEQFDVGHEE